MNWRALRMIEGSVVSADRAAVTPTDRPLWAHGAFLLGVFGLASCALVIALAVRVLGRPARHRGERALATGAVAGILLGRHGRSQSQSHVWRLRTTEGPVVARMAGGPNVDGLVDTGDEIALRGRFATSGVFCAYRGVNTTAGLRLVPQQLARSAFLGATVTVWLVVFAFAVVLR